VTVTSIPADAQRSDDGNWWWDGQQWQPVQSETHDDEVYVDPAELPELRLLAQSSSPEEYLQAMGIDPSNLTSD
jgi:hypothetical protein